MPVMPVTATLPGLDAAVLYTLDEADAEKITAWRENFAAFNAGMSGHKHPHRPGTPGSTGHVAHVGSPVRAGDVRPARVTAISDPESGRLNLKVSLDGSDFYWAAGVPPGDGPGQWADPAQEIPLTGPDHRCTDACRNLYHPGDR